MVRWQLSLDRPVPTHSGPIAAKLPLPHLDWMRTLAPFVASLVFAGTAAAHIPAGPMAEVGWAGPGHLCEAHFTLAVEPDEYVREDIQLEPSQPASNTIKSERGWFTISILELAPTRPPRSPRVRVNGIGNLYEFPDDLVGGRFVFLPSSTARPAVEITFYKVAGSPQTGDWKTSPQRSFRRDEYAAVLDRIAFTRTDPSDCLNPQMWEPATSDR